MASISKKKIALIEKYNQEKLRNQAMKIGVTLKSPETVFLSNDTKFGKNVIINPYVVIGKKTKMFICGDPLQSDINGKTGFRTMWKAFNNKESSDEGIHCFEFTKDDIMRNEILKFIVNKIENIPKIKIRKNG